MITLARKVTKLVRVVSILTRKMTILIRIYLTLARKEIFPVGKILFSTGIQ